MRTNRQPTRRWGVGVAVLLLALGSAALAVPPATAAPAHSSCPYLGAHQVRFVTTKHSDSNHFCGGPAATEYYQGWAGINGQITTPILGFSGSMTEDLAMGSIAMIRYAPSGARTAWIRTGWYAGNHPACGPTAIGEYRLFVEYSSDGVDNTCSTTPDPLPMAARSSTGSSAATTTTTGGTCSTTTTTGL